ncbi:hypothetical protein [Streptomyces spiralis]
MTASLDLPPTSKKAPLIIAPGLLSGLGITPHHVPDWITDPDCRASIAAGLIEIDDDPVDGDTTTRCESSVNEGIEL